jgi:tetratricopeptide (TPR) repeat protein
MYVTGNSPKTVLGSNQQVQNQLKLALQLGLRRQIFVAVCDDLRLMYHIAERIELEIAGETSFPVGGQALPQEQFGAKPSPGLVTLQLNLKDPSPINQIRTWLRKHPIPKISRTIEALPVLPNFQFLGVDLLTRKSSSSQWYFLNELQELAQSLPSLEFSLVFWLTRPWCRTIAQSAPEFWSCRTGLFEFAGEPTPTAEIDDLPLTTIQPSLRNNSELHKPAKVGNVTPKISGKPKSTRPKNSPVSGQFFHQNSPKLDPQLAPPVEKTEKSKPKADILPIKSIANLANPTSNLPKLEIMPVTDRASEAIANHGNSPQSNGLNYSGIDATLQQLITSTFPTLEKAANPSQHKHLSVASVRQIVADIEQLSQHQPLPALELANAYLALGNLYRVALARGESNATYLKIVIAAYEQTIKFRSDRENEGNNLGYELINDIGNFYWMLSRFDANVAEQISHVEQAIAAYEKSLTTINRDRQREAWAIVQNNLGSMYNELARQREPLKFLQSSIKAYEEVLQYRPNFQEIQQINGTEAEKIAQIQAFAATQNNLGTAYWNLAQHQDPLKNIKQAISAYVQALIALESQIHTNESPQWFLNYGMIQNNLGTAYWNLAQYENAEDNLQLAIGAYQIALMYRTPNAAPVACAATQNNLGTAYNNLAKHSPHHSQDKHNYLKQAIAAYFTALQIAENLQKIDNNQGGNVGIAVKPSLVTFDVLTTHNNLGDAYYQLAIETDSDSESTSAKTDLSHALEHYLKAWKGWQKKAQYDLAINALNHIVQTIKAFYNLFGVEGQNIALSQIPGEILPEVMPRLSAFKS